MRKHELDVVHDQRCRHARVVSGGAPVLVLELVLRFSALQTTETMLRVKSVGEGLPMGFVRLNVFRARADVIAYRWMIRSGMDNSDWLRGSIPTVCYQDTYARALGFGNVELRKQKQTKSHNHGKINGSFKTTAQTHFNTIKQPRIVH